jgi:hypothetical protein
MVELMENQEPQNKQKIKCSFKDFIGIFEGAASEALCDSIIEKLHFHMDQYPSEIRDGKTQFENHENGRRDYQVFANKVWGGLSKEINEVLDACAQAYADEFFIIKNLANIRSNEIKVQLTPPRGGYHVWHSEASGREVSDRVLVWTIYLNDIPDGEGETEFLWQGVRIKPKKGMICIFPAAFTHTHRGNPVHSCDKYIATGWYTFEK